MRRIDASLEKQDEYEAHKFITTPSLLRAKTFANRPSLAPVDVVPEVL